MAFIKTTVTNPNQEPGSGSEVAITLCPQCGVKLTKKMVKDQKCKCGYEL